MTDDVQSFQDYLKQLNSHKIQQEMRFQEMEDEYTTAGKLWLEGLDLHV